MRRSTWGRVVGAALTAALVAVAVEPTVGAAGPTTHRVDDDGVVGANGACNGTGSSAYTDIQPAVDAAGPGDTIIVCAGVYGGARIGNPDVDAFAFDNLRLLGAQAGVDARTRSALAPASESTVQGFLSIDSYGVTVDGFRIVAGGLRTGWEVGRVSVLNNVITNGIHGVGMTFEGHEQLARQNLLVDNPGIGIHSGIFALAASTIDRNTVIGSEQASVLVELGIFGDGNNHLTISNNRMDASLSITEVRTARITGNVLTGTPQSSMYLESGSFGNHDVIVDHNQIYNSGAHALEIVSSNGGTNNRVTAQSNLFRNSAGYGVVIGDDAVGADVNISYNQFSGNRQGGFRNDDADSPVMGTHNWWANASGPSGWSIGTGQSVSANVDFFPWATNWQRTTFAACTRNAPATGPLLGTAGNDILCGNDSANNIRGGPGADLILGHGGGDVIRGAAGNDVIVGDRVGTAGDDNIDAGSGTDVSQGRGGSDTIINSETTSDF
jgi:hypothetical protein